MPSWASTSSPQTDLRWQPPAVVAAAGALLLTALTAAVLATDLLPGEAGLVSGLHVDGGWLRDGSAAVSAASGSEPVAVVTAAVGALLLTRQRVRDAAVVLGAVGAALLVGAGLKLVVQRPRPELAVAADGSPYAYPSGHMAASAALVLALVVLLPRRASWLVVGALVVLGVAAAQLALGRHHPADLVAGGLLAVICVGCAEAVRRRTSVPGSPGRTPPGHAPDGR